jgi:hypothetical protein
MKLYYIPNAASGSRWQGTQADAKQVGGKHYEQREVPTDKPNLLAFLNAQELNAPPVAGPIEGPASTHGRPPDPLEAAELRAVAEANARPLNPDVGLADDGHPNRRPSVTSIQTRMMTQPRSAHVQDICYHVSKLGGLDLAWVAAEVFGRVTVGGTDGA